MWILSPWRCLEDQVTGLTWETKTLFFTLFEDNDLHSARWNYTWRNTTGINDGGGDGAQTGFECFGGTACSTEAFVAAVNAENYCGYSDWRLPTVEELYSIANLTHDELDLDRINFPNQRLSSSGSNRPTWTATPSQDPDRIWAVSDLGATVQSATRSAQVRLVRGGVQ